MNLGTSVGYFIEAERADALERAMRRFRADKAREAREALLVSTHGQRRAWVAVPVESPKRKPSP
jgi:hypothetical protein